jgi:hypothetical protein
MVKKVFFIFLFSFICGVFPLYGQNVWHLTFCIKEPHEQYYKRIYITGPSNKDRFVYEVDSVTKCNVASDFDYRSYTSDTLTKAVLDSILECIIGLEFQPIYKAKEPLTTITLIIFSTTIVQLTYQVVWEFEPPDSSIRKLVALMRKLDKETKL